MPAPRGHHRRRPWPAPQCVAAPAALRPPYTGGPVVYSFALRRCCPCTGTPHQGNMGHGKVCVCRNGSLQTCLRTYTERQGTVDSLYIVLCRFPSLRTQGQSVAVLVGCAHAPSLCCFSSPPSSSSHHG